MYNNHMETKYTAKEITEFSEFCKRHGIRFNTTLEMRAALDQYFIKD